MAYQWARLADEQDQSTDFLKASEPASEQSAAQQQQQIQSDDDKKE
jgi:hypothetical protein